MTMELDDLAAMDATAQAAAVRAGHIQPIELVEAAIARIERLNPSINAVISDRFEQALAEAKAISSSRHPFAGVPTLLKDHLTPSAGDPMHEGMRFLKAIDWCEDHDSFAVAKMRHAGLISLGKTNVPELALMLTTEPVAYGPTRNPWDLGRSPGGSSGGSAAAVASGMVAVAHGTDAGGSIRIPASACGVVGLKPTRGRVSQGPDLGDMWGNGSWHVHVLTRSVRDTAAFLDVLSGYHAGDPVSLGDRQDSFGAAAAADPPPIRAGVMLRSPAGFPELHEDCRNAAAATAQLLESLGHNVEEAHPEALDRLAEGSMDDFFGMAGAGVAFMLERWQRRTGRPIAADDVEPYTWAFAELGRRFSAPALLRALDGLTSMARSLSSWWDEGYDLLVTPTLAVPPFELGVLSSPPDDPLQPLYKAHQMAPFTGAWNITGQPAMSLPLHWTASGLPIGVQLISRFAREDTLLSVARQLESATASDKRITSIRQADAGSPPS